MVMVNIVASNRIRFRAAKRMTAGGVYAAIGDLHKGVCFTSPQHHRLFLASQLISKVIDPSPHQA
jgi:hypothetical protein